MKLAPRNAYLNARGVGERLLCWVVGCSLIIHVSVATTNGCNVENMALGMKDLVCIYLFYVHFNHDTCVLQLCDTCRYGIRRKGHIWGEACHNC